MQSLILGEESFGDTNLIHIKEYAENTFPIPHKHEFLEFEYVVSGKGTHIVGGKEYTVRGGDLFFTNYGTTHTFISASENDRILVIDCLFSPNLITSDNITLNGVSEFVGDLLYSSVFDESIRSEPHIHVRDNDLRFKKLFSLLQQEYAAQQTGYMNVLFALIVEIMTYMQRLYAEQSTKSEEDERRRRYIYDVLKYIEAHYTEKITLDELSKIALLSPTYLCKIFKQITGKTISEYVQLLKIEDICKKLTETNDSFSAIAYHMGYETDAFIRKLFVKETGMTPGEYRKTHQSF